MIVRGGNAACIRIITTNGNHRRQMRYDGAWGGGLSTIVVPTGPSNRVVDRRVVDDGHWSVE